ncbi:putative LysR-family regulatory protein [Halobacteriovorax marinus SJ]|uniref:LysR-family regulatory protein n=1 Tax=Halobacteriovorax marinus (strain ATCC BAA-682 / DSM 15412 / SJ) TaxID=862908 RepID=E1WZE2_HALMS|nr:LysR family transcriptional regulator [Halobacteriovorax marinus]CBW27830.1 putative LysR-family regulatory protein [Halobacteriovorax marinus SJ]
METNRLKQFITLYQTGNMRRASELLGISHSGLSKSLSILQDEFGANLYIPVGRGISFTDEGHALAKRIPAFLDSLDGILNLEKISDVKILRIGSFEVFTTYFAKTLAPVFSEYELDFHELVPGRLEKALLNREIDMAITYEPIPYPGIEHLKITEIEMGAYTKKGAFKQEELLSIPFAAPAIPVEGAPTGVKGLDSWPDDKFKREIRYRVDLMETAISMCRNGLCAVFLPKFVASLHNEIVKAEYRLVERELPAKFKKVKRVVYLVKRESTVETKQIKKLARYIRDLSKSL